MHFCSLTVNVFFIVALNIKRSAAVAASARDFSQRRASQPATVLSGGISAASLLTLLAFGSIWRGVHKIERHVSMGKKLINLPPQGESHVQGRSMLTSMLEAKKPHGETLSVAVGETLKY